MKKVLVFIALVMTSMVNSQNTCNCCTEKYAEFDFWVGTWTVTNPDGSAAGKNRIEKIQDNCIVRENWTSANGNYTGTSNNFYNANSRQWEQIWIDNQGQSLHLKGNRIGNQMILFSEKLPNQAGDTIQNRITWTLKGDGSVRQFWEVLKEGKETSVAFDGLYKKEMN